MSGGVVIKDLSLVTKDKITNLAGYVSQMEQVECPLTHRFAPGLYVRQIFMPAGTVVVSRVHKEEHLTVVLSGRATVVTEDGTLEITAPWSQITPAGTTRVLYIHEDSSWLTVHHNPDNIEDETILLENLSCKDFKEYSQYLLEKPTEIKRISNGGTL